MIVLIGLCLCLFLPACTTERKIYVNQPIPANLLSDCLPQLPPKSMTFGESLKYNEHLLNVIEKCNTDKRSIRDINNTK
ncbi:Rz1-like lysis system protein LysC [Gilliamella apicola]|uniref:Rz1-like lysis system protein LysC n=1 Tax=Gilliamella sp. wkB108 TaxID=3120256 RepID=UPI0009C066D1